MSLITFTQNDLELTPTGTEIFRIYIAIYCVDCRHFEIVLILQKNGGKELTILYRLTILN